MRLSAPIFRLKKQARARARAQKIPLHQALNQIAKAEGYNSWSLLIARYQFSPTASQILDRLNPSDMVLLAARPFEGKMARSS